jgi:hypothetical protein
VALHKPAYNCSADIARRPFFLGFFLKHPRRANAIKTFSIKGARRAALSAAKQLTFARAPLE